MRLAIFALAILGALCLAQGTALSGSKPLVFDPPKIDNRSLCGNEDEIPEDPKLWKCVQSCTWFTALLSGCRCFSQDEEGGDCDLDIASVPKGQRCDCAM